MTEEQKNPWRWPMWSLAILIVVVGAGTVLAVMFSGN